MVKEQQEVYYVNLDGICHSGIVKTEKQGRYLGTYLVVESNETKKQEFTFPDLLKDLNFFKKNKNKRISKK